MERIRGCFPTTVRGGECSASCLRRNWRRTQGPDEIIADYLVGLRHIMNYVSPSYSLEEHVDFAYANLHPNYPSRIERDQIRTLEELEAKGEQLEAARLLSREYRPPPAPQDSLFSEHAYNRPAANKSSLVAAAFETNGVDSSKFPPTPPNPNRNKGKVKVKNSSSNSPSHAKITNIPACSSINSLSLANSYDPNISVLSKINVNSSNEDPLSSSSSPAAEANAKGDRKCFWCEAPGITIRSCQNGACIERRQVRESKKHGRRSRSPAPPNSQ